MNTLNRRRQKLRTVWAVCLMLAAISIPARAWWDTEWTIRKKITIDTAAEGVAISEPIGTATVLVRLHDGNFQFLSAKEDGGDIRFVAADDKTPLSFHIEKYDPLLNEAFIWVKVSEIKPGEKTSIWLYYGNGGPKAVRGDKPNESYDAGTGLVYHFASGAALQSDTIKGHNIEGKPAAAEGSFIGGGLRLDGKSELTISAAPDLAWTEGGTLTWSAWIKPAAIQANAILFRRGEGAKALVIGLNNGAPFVEVNGQRSAASAPISPASWHDITVVAEGGSIRLYLDGANYSTLAAGLPALDGALQLGGVNDGFIGELDELEVANAARPAGWIRFAALSQGAEKSAALVQFGADEEAKSWFEGGYFGIIIKSLTFDGWVVIGLLAVMSAVSWWVMVSKARYLNRVVRANQVFTREWRRIETDPSLLDTGIGVNASPADQQLLRQSPLFRVYQIGTGAIQHRLALRPDQPRSLTARAIQAVRARLDGGQVIETERINSQIVLLTIAISGGPFLGLLGTVVGVMITFAAVAAAGDVNVNAIAPGIAAALLATVAGLGVAIPSLFGYNYLLARIKASNTAMHVFIDEFVTSMAEHYRNGPAE